MRALFPCLDLRFDAGAASATGSPGVELRIGLDNTREFGMVISAGLGGLDAGLAEGNLRQDRAVGPRRRRADRRRGFSGPVPAHARLPQARPRSRSATDRPPPDELLRSLFARLLELASIGAPGHPESPFVLQTLNSIPCRSAIALTRARRALRVRRAGCPPPAPPDPQDRQAAPSGLDRHHRRFGDQHEFRPDHPAQPDGQRLSEGAPDHHPRRRDGDRRRPMRREPRGARRTSSTC